MTDPHPLVLLPSVQGPDLPVASLRAILPTWHPERDCPVALSGGYSHGVYALGGSHVLRFAIPERAERLRHEAVILNDLGARPGLVDIADRLPRVVASFDGALSTNDSLSSRWRGWHGLIINRFQGSNAFRAWLGASEATRVRWVHEAVRILRTVHGFRDGTPSGPVPSSPALRYTCGWYGTRMEGVGSDWCECHRLYLSKLRDLLVAGGTVSHRNLLEASLTACWARLDALTTVWGPRTGHGDFHLHNIIVSGTAVTGVIDWEWGGLTEPDADLAHLLRWSLFPGHPADEDLEDRVSAGDFAGVPSAIWNAYPEVATIDGLEDRLFVYLAEHDLHQLSQYPESPQAIARLEAWLAGAHLTLTPRN